MKKILISLFLLINTLVYAVDVDVDAAKIVDNFARLSAINVKMQEVQADMKKNILIKRYKSYLAYREISKELEKLKKDYKKYSKWKGEKYKELSYNLNNKIRIKQNELVLIDEYKDSPIGKLITPHEIDQSESITNPFGIINALSYIKKLENYKKQFKRINKQVSDLLTNLERELDLYIKMYDIKPSSDTKDVIKALDKRKTDFVNVLDIVTTTDEVYSRKIEEVIIETKAQISNQIEKTVTILIIVAMLFVVSFLLKLALKKYFSQNENYYMANKVINFILVFLIIMIVMFSYIDNVQYLVTILGFASAGIAIALKDWFMSIFGWMVIVTSGSIHVGDRIKVQRDGIEAVGDVLDISLFKITIREDITYTSYVKNRRTGRIFFIPNNYVFSEMIANYTHSGLRTVWDGIDITITFDSNYKKAQHLSKEILKHYSKGYTDITRKQLSKMRSKYSLRATGVEPRVYTFVEPYGIVISSWYLTNSYAALALRSTMSPEILDAFMKEDDITIAFPTQTINVGPGMKRPDDLPDEQNIRPPMDA